MRSTVAIALIVASSAVAVEPPATDVAATVNDQPILLADLDAVVNANLPKVPITAAHRRQLRTALLDDLIDDALLKQFLTKNGPKVDAAEIEAQMKALTTRLTKDNRTLTQFLKETGQTEAQLREAWALQVQLAAYVKQEVTDEQLKAYHEANRDHFDKVEVRLSHIVIRTSKNAPATERSAAKEKLIALRADIAAGKTDFATAARKFSQCPSAKSGGDLGEIQRRALPEDETLAKAAFALKVGTLSDIVATDYGFHLLLVTERKPGTPSVLEKSVVEVLEAYTDDYRVELVKKLRKEAQIRVTLP